MSSQNNKDKSIQEAIRAIHKQFGSGSIMRLDGSIVQTVEVVPTGSVALDVALGCGGLPRGRIIEVFGRGKLTHVEWPEQRKRIEVDDVKISSELLRGLTGWRPRYSLLEGLARTKTIMERK